MANCTHPLHERLVALADPGSVSHLPWCGAHPALDDGPCECPRGTLAAVIHALVAVHHPRESRSINTLGCDAHRGHYWDGAVDHEACPDCVVTPITVCSSGGCEDYPCATIAAVGATLRLAV